MEKTLIGKNDYFFLKNDESKELESHCNNLCTVKNSLSRYNKYIDKFYITVFPDKSYIYKEYLPNNYEAKYRPALLKYQSFFNNRLFDTYDILKNIADTYYKTDTHINLNGAYQVYINFVKNINRLYKLDLPIKEIKIECKKDVILSELNIGLGDLTWDMNKGTQVLNNIYDNYYFSNDIIQIYYGTNKYNIIFYDYDLVDKCNEVNDKVIEWNILSNYILYKVNEDALDKRVVIFYDSLLLSTMGIYITMFKEVYMIKNVYDNILINKLNPDYIFEFRIERFLI